MKILYFYQYFSTPKGSWGTRVYEFSKEWVKEGHDVTIITSVYSKSDLCATKFIEDQNFEGINVKVINVKIDNKQSFFKRVWAFMAYSTIASYYALKLKADVVIASSGPITVGIPGLIAKYFRNRKLVFETRDLWPEGAIELGILKNRYVKRLCYWFEKLCYKSSSYIVTLSPGMTQNIKKRFNSINVDDVTNAANIELFSQKTDFNSSLVERKKYAIYTGNIGVVNNSYWLYNAAKILKERNRSDIKILVVGEGQQREEIVNLAKNEKVENFVYMGLMSKDKLIPLIQNAFVSIVPLKGTPILDTSSPNKFFESLAAGVPVIQNTQGWMKDFLENNNIGYTLDPNDANQLAEHLILMADDNVKSENMGKIGAGIAEKQFDKNYLAKKMLNILEKVHNN
jgi:glycosyltransferase involved in cell wall biosynthesis